MQVLTNGAIAGLCIGLLALAFQIVFMPTRIFFLGLAGIYVVAPYLFNTVVAESGSVALAVIATAILAAVLSMMMELLNHRPLMQREAVQGAHFISSLGIYIFIVQATVIVFGNDSQQLNLSPWTALTNSVSTVGGLLLTTPQIVMASVAIGILIPFFVILRRSTLGLRMRALADAPVQFEFYGYDVDRARLLAFAAAGAIAAIAALLTAYDIGFDPHTGLSATSLAIVAVFSGGRRSFAGPVLCGVMLGVMRAQVSWDLSARWQDACTFLLVVPLVMLRPQGLFGRGTRLEAREA